MNSKSFIRKRCAIIDDKKSNYSDSDQFLPPKDKKSQNKFGICSKNKCIVVRFLQVDPNIVICVCHSIEPFLKNLFLSKFNSTPNDGVIMHQTLVVDTFSFIIDFSKEQRFSVKLRCYSLTEWKNINLIYSKFDSQILE